jgi:hypothetical protein
MSDEQRAEPPRKPLARVAKCNLSDTWMLVWPPEAISKFKEGMALEVHPNENPTPRVGHATVLAVDEFRGALQFSAHAHVNAYFPTITIGDDIYEYKVPCTRCECDRCLDALHTLGNAECLLLLHSKEIEDLEKRIRELELHQRSGVGATVSETPVTSERHPDCTCDGWESYTHYSHCKVGQR